MTSLLFSSQKLPCSHGSHKQFIFPPSEASNLWNASLTFSVCEFLIPVLQCAESPSIRGSNHKRNHKWSRGLRSHRHSHLWIVKKLIIWSEKKNASQTLVTDQVLRLQVASWMRVFFIFCLSFEAPSACSILKIHQICQKIWHKMKKYNFKLALNPFFGWFRKKLCYILHWIEKVIYRFFTHFDFTLEKKS